VRLLLTSVSLVTCAVSGSLLAASGQGRVDTAPCWLLQPTHTQRNRLSSDNKPTTNKLVILVFVAAKRRVYSCLFCVTFCIILPNHVLKVSTKVESSKADDT